MSKQSKLGIVLMALAMLITLTGHTETLVAIAWFAFVLGAILFVGE